MTKDPPVSAARQFFPGLSVLALLVALMATGCSPRAIPTDNARLDGDTYTNAFFQFTMKVPDGWTIAKGGTLSQAGKTGGDQSSGDDGKPAISSLGKDGRSYHLLAATERPVGSPGKFTSSFAVLAERLSPLSSTKVGSDYLAHVEHQPTSAGRTRTVAVAPYKTNFGSREFYRMDIIASVNGRSFYHAYLTVIEKRYALTILITSETKEEVDGILAKLDSTPAAR
jgi:hypothetical protein